MSSASVMPMIDAPEMTFVLNNYGIEAITARGDYQRLDQRVLPPGRRFFDYADRADAEGPIYGSFTTTLPTPQTWVKLRSQLPPMIASTLSLP